MTSAVLSVRPFRRRTLGAAIAFILACLSIGAPMHAHEPLVSGLHDATPQGCPHKSDQGPCALCRLAQETSLAALTVQRIATPEPATDAPATAQTAEPAAPSLDADRPRGPPIALPNVAD